MNRTGTYVAFDALGHTDPKNSDFKYYALIKAWAAGKVDNFEFVDSHDKTHAVRDTSKRATLEARIRERLRASKNMLVILSSETRRSGSMLSYEIEQSVDTYDMPLIITYVDYQVVLQPRLLSRYWPDALRIRIEKGEGSMIHIPYAKDAIRDALPRFAVNGEKPNGTVLGHYSAEAHRRWGLLLPGMQEQNYLRL